MISFTMGRIGFRTAVAALAVMVSTGANAQIVFDWGGDTVSDSGKQTVKFNGPGKSGDIIVSFGDRKLYYITGPGIADSYPIAIPREQSRWEGVTSVSQKRENPSWTPTPTMLAENPRLPRWVPGGHPMNPLGNRALYLGSSTYRIHGTDAPWTIGTAASKGCVRLFNKDVADLYPRVKLGTKVTVTWQTFAKGTSAIATAPVGDTEKKPAAQSSNSQTKDYSTALFGGFGEQDDAAEAPQKKPAATEDEAKPEWRKSARKSLPAYYHKAAHDDAAAPKATPASATGEDAPPASVAASAAEPERKHKRAADHSTEKPRKSAKLETGAVEQKATAAPAANASPATAPAAKDDAALIAERAEAAANRAAAAAERAAAAAERALASKTGSGQ